ncbi:synaptic vesicle glycoprotein 2B [Halyomorpha halys]|uniref:synaptic vesicle glycoprotein 2B n=1 Tax=Halyomorpha halys TaxID=286706 RepID=UPI0006D50AA7|nr:organic cation/carnitine transporter 7-like [Halyomorpha halys]
MIWSQSGTLLIVVLWTFAPNTIALGIILFMNGLILTGTLTPVYVYVGEFCPPLVRAKALLGMTALMAMSNVYLPGMARIILPLGFDLPIFGLFTFTSWRLYILFQSIPVSLALFFLSRLPESPKFYLSQGKQDEAMKVLRIIYRINHRNNENEFPILSLKVDNEYEEESFANQNGGNQFFKYCKMMLKQFIALFSKEYIWFTLISCALLFGENGMCNTLVLWFPEMTSRIRHFSLTHDEFNTSLCNLMQNNVVEDTTGCKLNYQFLTAGILLGLVEVIACIFVGLCASRMNKKLVLSLSMFLSAGILFSCVFITLEYTLTVSLAVIIVILFVMFPVIISIIVELFPTKLRSAAASIIMTSARLGSALGGQIMGVLFQNHCKPGFFGIASIIIATGILCILIPIKKSRKKTQGVESS